MSNEQDVPKTLFEIVDEVLLQFEDANLKSDEARKKIASIICDMYYTDVYEENDDIPEEEFKATFEHFDDILQQGE